MTTASDFPSSPRALQFRITTLFVATAWIGVICLGMRIPSAALSAGIAVCTLLMTFTAAILAIYREGRPRAAAIGFAVFSGGFFACASTFPAYTLFEPLFHTIHDHWIPLLIGGEWLDRSEYRVDYFISICTTAVAFTLGVVGAIVAQILYATQRFP